MLKNLNILFRKISAIHFFYHFNIAKPIIEKLKNGKQLEEAYLDASIDFSGGVYVAQIVLDVPCNGSGLKVGDIITKIDDIKINKMCELREYIYSKNSEDEVTLYITRNNKSYSLKIKLGRKLE